MHKLTQLVINDVSAYKNVLTLTESFKQELDELIINIYDDLYIGDETTYKQTKKAVHSLVSNELRVGLKKHKGKSVIIDKLIHGANKKSYLKKEFPLNIIISNKDGKTVCKYVTDKSYEKRTLLLKLETFYKFCGNYIITENSKPFEKTLRNISHLTECRTDTKFEFVGDHLYNRGGHFAMTIRRNNLYNTSFSKKVINLSTIIYDKKTKTKTKIKRCTEICNYLKKITNNSLSFRTLTYFNCYLDDLKGIKKDSWQYDIKGIFDNASPGYFHISQIFDDRDSNNAIFNSKAFESKYATPGKTMASIFNNIDVLNKKLTSFDKTSITEAKDYHKKAKEDYRKRERIYDINHIHDFDKIPSNLVEIIKILVDIDKAQVDIEKASEIIYIVNNEINQSLCEKFKIVSGNEICSSYFEKNYTLKNCDHNGPLYTSCMRKDTNKAIRMYAKNPNANLLIMRDKGKTLARAILWKSEKGGQYMDRLFYANDKVRREFAAYCCLKGYKTIYDQSLIEKVDETINVPLKRFINNRMPYFDSLRVYNFKKGTLTNHHDKSNTVDYGMYRRFPVKKDPMYIVKKGFSGIQYLGLDACGNIGDIGSMFVKNNLRYSSTSFNDRIVRLNEHGDLSIEQSIQSDSTCFTKISGIEISGNIYIHNSYIHKVNLMGVSFNIATPILKNKLTTEDTVAALLQWCSCFGSQTSFEKDKAPLKLIMYSIFKKLRSNLDSEVLKTTTAIINNTLGTSNISEQDISVYLRKLLNFDYGAPSYISVINKHRAFLSRSESILQRIPVGGILFEALMGNTPIYRPGINFKDLDITTILAQFIDAYQSKTTRESTINTDSE